MWLLFRENVHCFRTGMKKERFRADQIILWLAENYSGHVTETSIIFHIRKMFNIKKIQLNKAWWGEVFAWNIRNQNLVKCVNYAKKNSFNHSISFQTIYSKMNKKLLKPLKYSFWAHFSQFRKKKFFKPLYSFEIQKTAMRQFWEISLTDRQTIGNTNSRELQGESSETTTSTN